MPCSCLACGQAVLDELDPFCSDCNSAMLETVNDLVQQHEPLDNDQNGSEQPDNKPQEAGENEQQQSEMDIPPFVEQSNLCSICQIQLGSNVGPASIICQECQVSVSCSMEAIDYDVNESTSCSASETLPKKRRLDESSHEEDAEDGGDIVEVASFPPTKLMFPQGEEDNDQQQGESTGIPPLVENSLCSACQSKLCSDVVSASMLCQECQFSKSYLMEAIDNNITESSSRSASEAFLKNRRLDESRQQEEEVDGDDIVEMVASFAPTILVFPQGEEDPLLEKSSLCSVCQSQLCSDVLSSSTRLCQECQVAVSYSMKAIDNNAPESTSCSASAEAFSKKQRLDESRQEEVEDSDDIVEVGSFSPTALVRQRFLEAEKKGEIICLLFEDTDEAVQEQKNGYDVDELDDEVEYIGTRQASEDTFLTREQIDEVEILDEVEIPKNAEEIQSIDSTGTQSGEETDSDHHPIVSPEIVCI
jgi:hypothetical protein